MINKTFKLIDESSEHKICLIIDQTDFIYFQDLIKCVCEMNMDLVGNHLMRLHNSINSSIENRPSVDQYVMDLVKTDQFFSDLIFGLTKAQPMIDRIAMPLSRIEI